MSFVHNLSVAQQNVKTERQKNNATTGETSGRQHKYFNMIYKRMQSELRLEIPVWFWLSFFFYLPVSIRHT